MVLSLVDQVLQFFSRHPLALGCRATEHAVAILCFTVTVRKPSLHYWVGDRLVVAVHRNRQSAWLVVQNLHLVVSIDSPLMRPARQFSSLLINPCEVILRVLADS